MTLPEGLAGRTLDSLLGGRLKLFQPEDGYRVAIDPVFLAASVDAPSGSRVLDAGCGTGAAMLCLLHRLHDVSGTGLDLDDTAIRHARESADLNNMTGRVDLLSGDLGDPPETLASLFDVVMTNPPFFEAGTVPPHPKSSNAHALTNLSLKAWIKTCLALLRRDGLFAIVHRADRVSEILQALKGCGATVIIPLWPKANQPARRVVITTRKDRRSPTVIHPGVVLHEANGDYTDDANAILRDGNALQTMS